MSEIEWMRPVTEDCGYHLDWWKEARAASLDRKRRITKATRQANPGDTFLIVTEGTVTEPVYFEFLLKDLQLKAVTVKVVPGRASDPRHVIDTAAEEVKDLKYRARIGKIAIDEPKKFDQVWAVIDTDVATSRGFWNDVKQQADAKKVHLAPSTPCFEYWLLLHLCYTTRGDLFDGATTKHVVEKELGKPYSTNEKEARDAMPCFIENWPKAVRHARQVREYHYTAGTLDPANPSTDLDLLVQALNDAAPAHAQRLL